MTLVTLFGALNASPASRCDTCANARVIKGYTAKERVVLCAIASPPLPIKFAVYECSSYIVNAAPPAPRPVGFVRTEELLRKQEKAG